MMIQKQLLELISFNQHANDQLIERIKSLDDKKEALRLLSHMINCQNKWLARIYNDPIELTLEWWDPIYTMDRIQDEWKDSQSSWENLVSSKNDNELKRELRFQAPDGSVLIILLKDLVLHLNYHSIHHRAQILSLTADHLGDHQVDDYIRTKLVKLISN